LEAALALLEGEEVVERPVVPVEAVGVGMGSGGVRVKVGGLEGVPESESEEIGDDERRTSGEDATPALVVDEPLPVVEARSEPASEEPSSLLSTSSTSISSSTITAPSDNDRLEELASSPS